MARKVDHAKAKAARQKKIAIGLGLLLVVVVAIQGPRTLKMLKGPSAPVAAPAPVATAAPSTSAAVVPPLGTPAATAPAAPVQPAVLASSDLPPAPGAGQLLSFELFESKDPFVQQVHAGATPGAAADRPAAADGDSKPAPIVPGADEAFEPGTTAVPSSGSGSTPPAETETVPPAAATTIAVNGVSEAVDEGKEFPLEDPIFVLVSTASDGKSVRIGIAGGVYADGKDTITLKLGKAVTLQNTADGSRYKLVLEAVAGFAPPGAKK